MEPDRLSELPDEVLHHILSSSPLSPRDPLRLSELSKRWRHLWRSTPFLNLTDGDFLLGECSQGSFTRFVDTLLSLRDTSDLLSFRLSWCMDLHPEGHHHLSAWLRYAVGHNSKVISLHFYEQMMDVVVPECVFTCQRLEELKIVFSKHTKVSIPGSVTLSLLRKCHLSHVGIVGASMDKLVSSCSVLEELTLKQSTLVSANIAFRALRHLDMEDCFVAGEVFRISCPSLLSCHLVRNFLDASKVLLENLSSVVSASVHNPYDAELKFRGSVMNIFGGLTNAETLKIISSRIQFITEKDLSELPDFCNLKNLMIGGWRMSRNFLAVAHCIQHSPKLQMLTLTTPENALKKIEAVQNPKQVQFHCPNIVIECELRCGEENERLVGLVTKAIKSKYTSPGDKVSIISGTENEDRQSG